MKKRAKRDGWGCSIYVVDRLTPEERERATQQYREERIAAGACPECLQVRSEVEAAARAAEVNSRREDGENDVEYTVRIFIDGLRAGRPVGTCKTCGLTIWQPVL